MFSLPWGLTFALTVLLVLQLTTVEAFLDFTVITEDTLESRITFACAFLWVQRAMHTTNLAGIVLRSIGAIHTGAGGFITLFPISTVQFAGVAFATLPLALALTFTFTLVEGPSIATSWIGTLIALHARICMVLFALAAT